MKKQLAMALALSFAFSGAGTALAAEQATDQDIHFDGSIVMQWRSQKDSNRLPDDNGQKQNDITKNGFKALLTLKASAPISKNLDVYTRFTYEKLQHDWGTFMADYHSGDESQSSSTIDAYGLSYKNAGYTYTLGKQYLTLGQGLLYDNTYIGKHSAPYALAINGRVGATDMSAVYFRTDYQDKVENDKVYALQGSYNITPKTSIGAMYAHASYGLSTYSEKHLPKRSINYYSVFGSHQLSDKATFSAEYLRASVSADGMGYQAGINYKMDKKNSVSTTYYYIEDQANIIDYDLDGMTTGLSNNAKGYLVSYKHKIDKDITLGISDFHYKKMHDNTCAGGATTDRDRFYTTMTVTF